MKNWLKVGALFAVAIASLSATKKTKSFQVEKVINVSANKIWKIIAEDYGAVANSHPKIVSSEYISGSLKGEVGAERVCYFNEKGSQFLKEKIIKYDEDNMTYTNQIFQAGKFPVDAQNTKGTFNVIDLGNGSCKLTFDMQFRTKPAFMGGLMKGNFESLINDYFIAIEHHAKTGQNVNTENFKQIKKQYK